jgi:hypothetical protein
MLEQLEARCGELGVKVIYDELRGEGGPCRLNDCYLIVINRRAAVESRVRIISAALPAIEERIAAARETAAAIDEIAAPAAPAPGVAAGVPASN